jgi:stage V sporulation protein AC
MDKSENAKKNYQEMVKQLSPNSKIISDCFRAFLVGGFICVIGQGIYNLLMSYGLSKDGAGIWVAVILVFTAVLLTGLGLYEKIGKFAGAGSVVPITGFANAIAAPAIEFKKEGYVLGVGAKMFLVAGPVIVYGTVTSVIVGIIYYVWGLLA